MNCHDVRMVQGRQRLRFAREALGEFPVSHTLRREEFERHETFQGLLPRLVNDAHAATSEAFEDFKLRKVRREFLRRKRFLRRGRLRAGLRRRHCLGHQTARAQATRCGRRQGRAALWAGVRSWN